MEAQLKRKALEDAENRYNQLQNRKRYAELVKSNEKALGPLPKVIYRGLPPGAPPALPDSDNGPPEGFRGGSSKKRSSKKRRSSKTKRLRKTRRSSKIRRKTRKNRKSRK